MIIQFNFQAFNLRYWVALN